MGNSTTELFDQALALQPNMRLMLAESLISSVGPMLKEDVETYWRREIEQRLESLENGGATTISWDDAMAQMEKLVDA